MFDELGLNADQVSDLLMNASADGAYHEGHLDVMRKMVHKYELNELFQIIQDIAHKLEAENKMVLKSDAFYAMNVECAKIINKPFIYSKKKLAAMRRYVGAYSVTVKQHSTTRFVAHYADLTLSAFNRMTNGMMNEFRKNLKYTTAGGRDNIFRLKIIESGYFQINNRFVQSTLRFVTRISKAVQGDNNPYYLNPNESKAIIFKLQHVKQQLQTELDENANLTSTAKRDLNRILLPSLNTYFFSRFALVLKPDCTQIMSIIMD